MSIVARATLQVDRDFATFRQGWMVRFSTPDEYNNSEGVAGKVRIKAVHIRAQDLSHDEGKKRINNGRWRDVTF